MPVLIDGDIIVYRCAASMRHAKHDVYTVDGLYLFSADNKNILNAELRSLGLTKDDVEIVTEEWYDSVDIGQSRIRNALWNICDKTMWPNYMIFVTGETNFRNDIATIAKYKGERPERPKYYQEMKDYLWSLEGVVASEGCEADDLMGIAAFQSKEGYTIATLDKDLDMIPGAHYDFAKDMHYEVTPAEAIRNFYRQLLTGDRVDNIQGIDGIGPKTAEKLIHDHMTDEEEMFVVCLEKYIEMYQKAQKNATPDVVLELAWSHIVENGQLLWIWRAPQNIWQPPLNQQEATAMLEWKNNNDNS